MNRPDQHSGTPAGGLLDAATLGRLSHLRLGNRRRVEGRFAGAHASRRHGSSLEFADYREYVAGDDLRRVDPHAQARFGRLLVKLYEAEDEAALRVVVDMTASMTFGGKALAAQRVAAALSVIAAAGGDRVRVLLAGVAGADAGPWYRGPATPHRVAQRLLAATPDPRGTATDPAAGLLAALRRAHAEGPRGPVVLVSDLLFETWDVAVEALAAGRGDAVLVHLVGRDDLDPTLDGDLRLADAETGAEVEVGIAEAAVDAYAATRDWWLDAVARSCGGRGVTLARLVDDEPVESFVAVTLAGLGVVG
jgi:uncharacterized protein (DUF58 family)